MSEFGDPDSKLLTNDPHWKRDSTIIGLIFLALLIIPPILAYYFNDSIYLFAWIILIILGLAG